MSKFFCGYCKREIKKNSRKCPFCGKIFNRFEREEEKSLLGFKLKKYLLLILLFVLGISALFGSSVFIFGLGSALEGKVLSTLILLAGLLFFSSPPFVLGSRGKFHLLSYSSLLVSFLTFVYGLLLIWEVFENGFFRFEEAKPLFVLGILSIATVYSCFILLFYKKNFWFNCIIWVALSCAVIFSSILIGVIIWEWDVGKTFFRVAGVFAISLTLGAVSLPILNKVLSLKN